MKSYTDLEQSKKLAEILPLESADMAYCAIHNIGQELYHCNVPIFVYASNKDIPCWSLAALLKLLPKSAQLEKGDATELYRVTLPVELESSDWYIESVDACYEMILKLNELKML